MSSFQIKFSKKFDVENLDFSKTLVIVPTYNEALNIEKAINNLLKIKDINFIIIDDCSTDNTEEILKEKKWNYIRNQKNLRLAKSFKVGIQYAINNGYKYVIQFDGDGQHDSSAILEMVYYANKGYDIVLTSRYLANNENITTNKKLAHKILNLAFFIKTFRTLSDPTCGLRLYNWQVMELMLKNKKLQPEPSAIAYFIKKEKMKIKEVPTIVYEREYGESTFKNKWKIFSYMNQQFWGILFSPKRIRNE